MTKNPWWSRIVLAASLTPLLWLAWKWRRHDLGINSIEFVARYTGGWTLRFLLLTLAITPLRRIPGLRDLIRFRRMLGLVTFFYATLHALHYFAIDAQWNREVLWEDFTVRRFFIAGLTALTLLVPLAATSFDAAVRWLGARRWQRLHRLIYASAIAAICHYIWQGKYISLTPLLYAGVLAVLLLTRIVVAVRKRIKGQRS